VTSSRPSSPLALLVVAASLGTTLTMFPPAATARARLGARARRTVLAEIRPTMNLRLFSDGCGPLLLRGRLSDKDLIIAVRVLDQRVARLRPTCRAAIRRRARGRRRASRIGRKGRARSLDVAVEMVNGMMLVECRRDRERVSQELAPHGGSTRLSASLERRDGIQN